MARRTEKVGTRKPFRREDKIRMLLWCDRHCCLCDKTRGIDIEIAHIGDRTDNRFDNGIPVCYDCHAKMGAYNDLHPRGNKLTGDEIKARREQIYGKYTRPYVAPIDYRIDQALDPWNPGVPDRRNFPDVSFCIVSLSDSLPTRLMVTRLGLLNNQPVDLHLKDPLYRGEKMWNLNPRRGVRGHFEIMNPHLRRLQPTDRFEVRARITQEDPLGRRHELLEDGYVYKQGDDQTPDSWYFEP